MFPFGKSEQQKRIDADALVIAGLRAKGFERDKAIDALRGEVESLRESSFGADRTAAMYKRLYEGATKRLAEIAAQETPTANATVKRMARMARAELPILHHASAMAQPKPNGTASAVQEVA